MRVGNLGVERMVFHQQNPAALEAGLKSVAVQLRLRP
jgi:hypothetical protein